MRGVPGMEAANSVVLSDASDTPLIESGAHTSLGKKLRLFVGEKAFSGDLVLLMVCAHGLA